MIHGWIGVDFDGTLATDLGSTPIPLMVERIKRWLAAGIEVRIVTARVSLASDTPKNVQENRREVERWCLAVFGQVLPVTCEKDYRMYQLWDDRAVQVIKDTGERVGNVNRTSAASVGELIDEESGYRR